MSVAAGAGGPPTGGRLVLDAELRGYGVEGGGTLAVTAGKVVLGAKPSDAGDDVLALAAPLFQQGFSGYEITGSGGASVAEGARIDVSMPVYRPVSDAMGLATGAPARAALETWQPPVYLHDPVAGTVTRRRGASLSLQSGRSLSLPGADADAALLVGRGAQINVDPGQSIQLRVAGQITALGALTAAGGKIDIRHLRLGDIDVAESIETAAGQVHNRSIWIGEQAVLNVAGRAETGVDAQGRRYGVADAGGVIVIGGEINHDRATATASDAYVIIRPGAVLDASGSTATVDVNGVGPLQLDRNGGRIALSSYNGLFLDGTFIARAGGASASGGALDIALETPLYRSAGDNPSSMEVQVPRELVLAAGSGPVGRRAPVGGRRL
ncbi:hypothetical protein G6F57_014813 [Rhizopus arrhizus]|nr:hypothetical protein G6F57_014813 [Rhizopus arrhizus]